MSTPPAMHAITLPSSPAYPPSSPAPASTLTLLTLPVPTPSPTELLIHIHAVALTPYELTWPITYSASVPQPRILGQDVAGVVVSAPEESAFKEGDSVVALLPLTGQGGMAEYAVCEEKFVAKLSGGVGFIEAASLPRAALTAWQAVRVQKGGVVKKGMKVLITGATGAVGRMAVQILRLSTGAKGRVATVGGKGGEELKELGADSVLDYKEVRTWDDVLMKEEEGGFDFVLDVIGGKTLERCLKLVKDNGWVVTVGSPAPVWDDVKGWKEARERGVKGWFFIVEESGEQLGEIVRLVEEGVLNPSVSLVVDGLTEEGMRDAWMRAERGGMAGSVVVKVRD